MIQRLLTLFLVLGCLLSCSNRSDAKADMRVAQLLAKHEDKFMLLGFFSDECSPCKLFSKDHLEDPRIAALFSSIILVSIDSEKGTGVDLAAEYKVVSYPTFVLMEADGSVIRQWEGYQKLGFLPQMQDIMMSEGIPIGFP